MTRATLPTALTLMFGSEGGYSNRKTDSGGPTKYGVTHKTLAAHRGVASVTAQQVKEMTLNEAEDIYMTGYWTQSGGDLLPAGLDYAAFDFGVNSGPARAVKVLQRLVGVSADGNIGPQTVAAVSKYEGGVRKLIVDYCDARMAFLRSLTNPKTGFPVNGRGWTIRVTGKDPKGQYPTRPGVIGEALRLVNGAKGVSVPLISQMEGLEGDAKAVPSEPNPWTTPETVIQIATGAGGLSFVATGNGPVQWAVGAALVVGALVAAYLFIARVRKTVV